jgi:hypothetical protein
MFRSMVPRHRQLPVRRAVLLPLRWAQVPPSPAQARLPVPGQDLQQVQVKEPIQAQQQARAPEQQVLASLPRQAQAVLLAAVPARLQPQLPDVAVDGQDSAEQAPVPASPLVLVLVRVQALRAVEQTVPRAFPRAEALAARW